MYRAGEPRQIVPRRPLSTLALTTQHQPLAEVLPAAAAFRQAKYVDWFRCLARGDKEWIDLSDLTLYICGIADRFDFAAGGEDLTKLIEIVGSWWTDMASRMDVNDDGAISIDEFIDFYAAAAEATEREGSVQDWANHIVDAVFDALDIDGDGFISVEEYASYLEAIGSDGDAAAAFARLDLDADGKIDVAEIDALYRDWICMGHPRAPGNMLLTGRMPLV